MAKIIVRNAVKRKPGFLYSINSEGDLIESPGPESGQPSKRRAAGFEPPTPKATDDKQEIAKTKILGSTNKLSYNDIEKQAMQIRNQSLRRLLKLLSIGQEKRSLDSVSKILKVSKRTAYDYLKTIKILQGLK